MEYKSRGCLIQYNLPRSCSVETYNYKGRKCALNMKPASVEVMVLILDITNNYNRNICIAKN